MAGRNWKTNHLDWKRRIAFVEPTDEKGRSRWLGEGQFLSFRVCQAIRQVLAADSTEPTWSQRATAQINELRQDYPWLSVAHTTLRQKPNGDIEWWTFAVGLANTLLADHLGDAAPSKPDNLCLRFGSTLKLTDVETALRTRLADPIVPIPNDDAIEHLKFGECLPPPLVAEVFGARFSEPEATGNAQHGPLRVTTIGM